MPHANCLVQSKFFLPACMLGALLPSVTFAGLEVTALGKNYTRNPVITPDNLFFSATDGGGSTSIRNMDAPNLDWKEDGYYQRNRDLGQIFNLLPGQDLQLDALILRTGNSSSAIRAGSAGKDLFVQFFEVIGTPTINNNGTGPGQQSTHGFTTHHSADDYIEGVTYQSLHVVTGGMFPNLAATTQNGGQEGHLQYLRWDLTGNDEIVLAGGKRYAFIVGFTDPGWEQGFTLGNANRVGSSQLNNSVSLFNDPAGQQWWSIRREGDGTLPPTRVPGVNPPSNPTVNNQLINESLFATGSDRYNLSPTTDGYPDVDTYRTFTFYLETKAAPTPPPPPPTPKLKITKDTAGPSSGSYQSEDSNAGPGIAGTSLRYNTNSGTNLDRGQTFTASDTFTLDKIVVQLTAAGSGAAGASFGVEMWQKLNGNWTLMNVSDGDNLPGSLAAGDFLTLDIIDTALTAGNEYGFLLRFDSLGINQELELARTGDSYAGGSLWQRTLGTGGIRQTLSVPTLDTSRDMVFFLQPVPEPASVMLLALGGSMLLVRRR